MATANNQAKTQPAGEADAAPAQPTPVRKTTPRKRSSKPKVQPPEQPAAKTRIAPTAPWPFPTGERP